MKHVYLGLTIIGTVVPYVFFIQHFQTAGFGPLDFLGGLFANGAAGGLTADLVVSSVAFWVYLFQRRWPTCGSISC